MGLNCVFLSFYLFTVLWQINYIHTYNYVENEVSSWAIRLSKVTALTRQTDEQTDATERITVPHSLVVVVVVV